MSYSAAGAVARARLDVGFREGSNNRNPYTEWQTRGTIRNAPWCASAVSKWSCDAGFDGFDRSCVWGDRGDWNVGAQRHWAQRRGIWRSAGSRARPGMLVPLTFGMPDQHVEMVLADNGGPVATIGGNTGDMVAYRLRPRRNVIGFIALDELAGNVVQSPDVPEPEPVPPPEEDLLTTVAAPFALEGRSGTARPVRPLGGVLLENGARLQGDKASGKNHFWIPNDPTVHRVLANPATAHTALIDIAPTVYPPHHAHQGQADGRGIVALYDLGNHDIATYVALWR